MELPVLFATAVEAKDSTQNAHLCKARQRTRRRYRRRMRAFWKY
jgi:hypothetical protein